MAKLTTEEFNKSLKKVETLFAQAGNGAVCRYFFFAYIIVSSVTDPYHLSGSTSGNVDLDPGSKKNRDKLTYKSTKITKIIRI